MGIKFSFIDILLAIGVVQGLFLTFILLLIKKGNTRANRVLALFILSFSLLTIGDILYETHIVLNYPGAVIPAPELLF